MLWLWVGAFINSLCLISCCLTLVFMFILEESPKDLVLDAFGLLFLQRLDDVVADLSFLRDRWNDEFMGVLYGNIANRIGKDWLKQFREEQTHHPASVYDVANCFMKLLCFAVPLFYMCVNMRPA